MESSLCLSMVVFVACMHIISTEALPDASNFSFSGSCPSNNSSLSIGNATETFNYCLNLGVQGARLAWSLNSTNNSIEIAFMGSAPSPRGWVGWGINPNSLQMSGTQAFIAFINTTSGIGELQTYDVTPSIKEGGTFLPGSVNLNILGMQVGINGTNMVIYVKLKLNPGQISLHHVWNRGPSVTNLQPASHSLASNDLEAMMSINMLTSEGTSSSAETLQTAHGVINMIAWGILFPLGVIFARYIRPFSDPLWFYLHIGFQCSAFVLGIAGFATGLKLGGGRSQAHKAIGITLFIFSTLQVMALLLRPAKDHKIRKFWNIYHHSIGYSIIILSAINIFKGLDILSTAHQKWHNAYISIVVVLGFMIITLEILTWYLLLPKNKTASQKQYETPSNEHNNDAYSVSSP